MKEAANTKFCVKLKKRFICLFLDLFLQYFYFDFSSVLLLAHFEQQAACSLPSITVVAVESLHNSGVISESQNSHFVVLVFIFSPRWLLPVFLSNPLWQHAVRLQLDLSSAFLPVATHLKRLQHPHELFSWLHQEFFL